MYFNFFLLEFQAQKTDFCVLFFVLDQINKNKNQYNKIIIINNVLL